jgi:metal-responsive CopG/Arc/MetJ family transcriptional regulator
MRTTIEIPDRQRAKLLEIAARRGLKGFSVIVQEAIEHYLEINPPVDEKVEAALSVLGTMSDEQADAIEASIQQMRENWR